MYIYIYIYIGLFQDVKLKGVLHLEINLFTNKALKEGSV